MLRSTSKLLKLIPDGAQHVTLQVGYVPSLIMKSVTREGIYYEANVARDGGEGRVRGHVRTGSYFLSGGFSKAKDTARQAWAELSSKGIPCDVSVGPS